MKGSNQLYSVWNLDDQPLTCWDAPARVETLDQVVQGRLDGSNGDVGPTLGHPNADPC